MLDRTSSRIKNNLSEQLKIFYDYTKDVQTKVIKPNPLPAYVLIVRKDERILYGIFRPRFRVNTDVLPIRKSLPIQISDLPRLSSSNLSDFDAFDSPAKPTNLITPSRDLSKLSLSLNVNTKQMNKIYLIDFLLRIPMQSHRNQIQFQR